MILVISIRKEQCLWHNTVDEFVLRRDMSSSHKSSSTDFSQSVFAGDGRAFMKNLAA